MKADHRSRALSALALLLGLAAIALVLPAGPTSAATTCPGRNGELTVVVERPSGSDRIGIVLQRSQSVRTLLSGDLLSSPSVSCDGRKILYREDEESETCGSTLHIANVSTGGSKQIPTPRLCPYFPALLSSGKAIFTATKRAGGGHPRTYIANPGAFRPRLLFDGAQLAASADGHWFIGTDQRGGIDTLYLLNARGKRVRRLVPRFNGKLGEYIDPSFSPNDRWIVYGRQIYGRPGRTDLYLVRRNGLDRHRLTWGGESRQPTFSPDGRWIAFVRGVETRGDRVLALSARHPSRVKVLAKATAPAGFAEPAWGPR